SDPGRGDAAGIDQDALGGAASRSSAGGDGHSIGVFDELLLAVGQGPVVYVPNPEYAKAVARKKRDGAEKELPPKEIQQTSCAYLVAAKVIRKTEDKVSSPVAALLNGLLGGDKSIVQKTSIACANSEEWGVKKKGTIVVTAPSNNDSAKYSHNCDWDCGLESAFCECGGQSQSNPVAGRRLFGARTSDVASDVNIGEILEVLRTDCLSSCADMRKKNSAEDKFGWTPQKVFECVSFPDAKDPDMRNRGRLSLPPCHKQVERLDWL
ncbi:hypothetical protein ACHAW6_000038, partial [Cyclotella cf. meneghiniana]